MPYDDFEERGGTPREPETPIQGEADPDIEEIASAIEPGETEGSILDDDTALSALRLLKQELFNVDCDLTDFKIGFSPTGFDIKGLQVRCSNPEKVMTALRDVPVAPGQLKPQSLYDKKPNSYSVSAILGVLKRVAEDELGLSLRAAAYENDYVVLSFFPAEEKPELPPEMPLEPPLAAPGEEGAPEGEEGAPEGEEGEEGGEAGLEDLPVEEVDWEAMGI
jgi:hypothetical protein